jgi:DNA-binding transcriptional LysR family regulator
MEMLNEMMVFTEVVSSGGFSAAARLLGLETSSVSRSVARLEKHLGSRLLHRTTRSIALTEVGEQVFRECSAIAGTVRSIQSVASRFHAEPHGTLRISAPVAFGQLWLAPRLAGFMEKCPSVDLRLTLIDRPVDLMEDGIDLALRISADWQPGLVVRKLFFVRYVLIASPSYLGRHGVPTEPAQLQQHCCIHLGHGAFGATWSMHRGDQRTTVTVPSRMTLNNSLAIAAACAGGCGIGLIPEFSARSGIDAGTLVEVLPDWGFDAPYRRDAALVYLPGPHVPNKIRAFVDHLVSTV